MDAGNGSREADVVVAGAAGEGPCVGNDSRLCGWGCVSFSFLSFSLSFRSFFQHLAPGILAVIQRHG